MTKYIKNQYTEDFLRNVIHVGDKVIYATKDNELLLHQGTVTDILSPNLIKILPKYLLKPTLPYWEDDTFEIQVRTYNVVKDLR